MGLGSRGLMAAMLIGACSAAPGAPSTARVPSNVHAPESLTDAEPRKPRPPHEKLDLENLTQRLTPYVESIGTGFGPAYRASGIVAVSAGGQIAYERAFGYANYEKKAPIDAATSFRVANLTKLFTAVAVLQLAERGELSLDDAVGKHLPEYPAPGSSITIEQLLVHTSGLPSHRREAARSGLLEPPVPLRGLIESFWAAPTEFEPGSDFRFSDSGYVLLGAIVEAITGKAYGVHLKREVLDRHELRHTSAEGSVSNRAHGYAATNSGARLPASERHPSFDLAAADLRSSATDLLAFWEAIREGQALAERWRRELLTPRKNDYSPAGFVRERHGHRVIELAGETSGFFASFTRVPELDLAVVVLSNSSGFNAAPIAEVALRCALGQPIDPLPERQSVEVSSEVRARFLGTYRLSESSVIELAKRKVSKQALRAMRSVRLYEKDERLFLKPIGQSPVAMSATSESNFVLMGGKASVRVELPPGGGETTRLVLSQGPLELQYVRKPRIRGKAPRGRSLRNPRPRASELPSP